MANVYLPDAELKRLKKLARANGYKIKRGPGSQIGAFIVRLIDEFEKSKSHQSEAAPRSV
jgi:hypothetical protein